MVKGQAIKQRDTIDVPKVNYRELAALNVSMIKLFDTDPVKFFEQYKLGRKKEDSKGLSLVIGDLVDFYLLDCGGIEEEFDERFEEKFALFQGVKGSGQVFTLADELFKLTKEDTDDNGVTKSSFDARFTKAFEKCQAANLYKKKTEDQALKDFYDNGYVYFQTQLDNIGKQVVEESVMEKAKKVAKLLKNDPFTADIFVNVDDDVEYFPKLAITWNFPGLPDLECKSEIDMLKVDHHEKKIYLMDLKTTYDNELFDLGYIKNGYYLQAAFYYLAVTEWMKLHDLTSYELVPMEFIVGDTSSNNRRPVRYRTSMDDLHKGLFGFSLKGVYHRGIHELISEISWAEETDNWNVSRAVLANNGVINLNIQYDKDN